MIKVIHTSDWHLGKKLERYDRLPEQMQVLSDFIQYCLKEKPDVILIAGDVFDQFNPSNEAMALYYKTLRQLTCDGTCLVIAIAGNHDSPERLKAPDPLALGCGIVQLALPDTVVPVGELNQHWQITQSDAGFFEVKCNRLNFPIRIFAMPFANENRLKQYLGTDNTQIAFKELVSNKLHALANKYADDKGVNIGLAHLYVTANISETNLETESERGIVFLGGSHVLLPTDFPEAIQYWALGHLHTHHPVGRKSIRYSGSLLQYSFDEAGLKRGFIRFELEPGKPFENYDFIEFNLPKQIRHLKAQNLTDAANQLAQYPNDYVNLTIHVCESLKSSDRNLLSAINANLVHIIPVFDQQNDNNAESLQVEHLVNHSIDELFQKYFASKHQHTPSANIMQIFKEILNQ